MSMRVMLVTKSKTSFNVVMKNADWRMSPFPYPVAILFALVAVVMAYVGGPDNRADFRLLADLSHLRLFRPWLESSELALTRLGTGVVLIPVGVAVIIAGLRRRGPRAAGAAAAALVAVRLIIEITKTMMSRPRPMPDVHPITTFGFSFPSAHSGNSLATALVAVVLLVPAARRRPWLAAAIGFGVIIGLTRPLLGVHWPSDVIAGWSIAVAVVMVAWRWIDPLAAVDAGTADDRSDAVEA